MKKKFRLKKNHEIAAIVLKKQKVAVEHYSMYYQKRNDGVKIAISASKKYGNAVERNHAKRHVREIMRPLLKTLPSYSLVIVIKDASKNATFEMKRKSLEKLIEKMIRKENLSNE